jgi:hypothetical protein
MKRLQYLFAVASLLVMALVSSSPLHAQFLQPLYVQDGVTVATDKARDTLASDAVLVYAGAFGGLDVSEIIGLPLTLNFYQDTIPGGIVTSAKYPGHADAWGYVFYSQSRNESVNLLVAESPLLDGKVAMGVPVSVPIPPGLVSPLNTDVPGFRSDSLMMRLKRDTAYVRYHAEFSTKQPTTVTIGNVVPDSLPAGFPTTGAIWGVNFVGTRDSTTGEEQTPGMLCFVAAESGETRCRRVAAPATLSVGIEDATIGHASLAVAPNPATGRTRVSVDIPDGISPVGSQAALFDATGRKVMDLSESLAKNSYSFIEFDASTLPAGVYYCRIAGRMWNGTIGVVVGE